MGKQNGATVDDGRPVFTLKSVAHAFIVTYQ